MGRKKKSKKGSKSASNAPPPKKEEDDLDTLMAELDEVETSKKSSKKNKKGKKGKKGKPEPKPEPVPEPESEDEVEDEESEEEVAPAGNAFGMLNDEDSDDEEDDEDDDDEESEEEVAPAGNAFGMLNDEDSDEEEDDDDDDEESEEEVAPARNAFDMLDDEDDEEEEDEEEEEAPPKPAPKPKKNKSKRKSKGKKQPPKEDDDDEFADILAELDAVDNKKSSKKSSKKGSKRSSKKDEGEGEDDLDAILADINDTSQEPAASKSPDADGDGDDVDESKLTKAQLKRRRKKQRQKEAAAKKAAGKAPQQAEAAGDDDDDDDATSTTSSSKKKKKKKKKGKKGPPVNPKLAALREQMELRKKEEELRKRLEAEARRAAEEEERRIKEEEERAEQERLARLQRKKEERERQKREGTYVSKRQKQRQREAAERLKQMQQAGMIVEGLDSKPKKPSYGKKRRSKGKKKNDRPSGKDLAKQAELKKMRELAQARADEEAAALAAKREREAADKAKREELEAAIDAAQDQLDALQNPGAAAEAVAEAVAEAPTLLSLVADGDGEAESWEDAAVDSWEDAADSWEDVDEEEEVDPAEVARLEAERKAKEAELLAERKAAAEAALADARDALKAFEESLRERDEREREEREREREEQRIREEEAARRRAEEQWAKKMQEEDELEAARGGNTNRDLRSPICCILGHVDTGKTKLLDKIRSTNVQDGEAGGITQQIGATYFPMRAIKAQTAELNESVGGKLKYDMPGLLVIDTPGHESFTNLRSRGSNLCDIAILVVDIMHGLEPQTLESLQLLRDRKTPFVVALNKVDRLYNWQAIPNAHIKKSMDQQPPEVHSEFQDRVSNVIMQFQQEGLNCELYFRNKDFKRNVSLVPTSAHTGEGVPDLLMLLVQLTQSRMSAQLSYISSLQCTVLEVKVVAGLGTTIDVVLVNGVLHQGDTIVVCGLHGPIVTQIRALLTPQPLKELRVKGEYVHHEVVKAAMGVKISAPGLEDAIAGSQMLVCNPGDDVEDLKDEVMSDLGTILSRVDGSGKGVCVQASTLGSLEALLSFLEDMNIPVSGISIGPVYKKDVMRAGIMLESRPEFAVILAFDVEVSPEAKRVAKDCGVRIFTADIIYHLFDQMTEYMEEVRQQARLAAAPKAVFPCILAIERDCIFRRKNPIIVGVKVLEGFVRPNTPLAVITKGNVKIGHVLSIENNHQAVQEARAGATVALKIDDRSGSFDGNRLAYDDTFASILTRESIDLIKDNWKDELTREDWMTVIKLKKHFAIM